MDVPMEPRRSFERDEPWRITHLRLLDKRLRAGGVGMSKEELAKARKEHSVSVPIGSRYTPLTWDPADSRVANVLAYQPAHHHEHYVAHCRQTCDLVLRTPYVSAHRDRQLLHSLHELTTWAELHHFSTNPESLLTGDRIDPFINREEWGPSSRSVHRWRLRFIASCVFPPAVEGVISRNKLTSPHTDEDLERFQHAALSIHRGDAEQRVKRVELHRDLDVLMALSFGAGCNGRMVHKVQQSWLHETADGWWLNRPDRDHVIPILGEWTPTLNSLVSDNPHEYLLSPHCGGRRSDQAGKVLAKARKIAPAFRDFDLGRACRHWEVTVLERAGFTVLAGILGYRPGSQTLGDLLPFLPAVDDDIARTLARRWAP